ncbi:MAG: MoaD/ThiS family protein [Chloroflexi bacterium]|nr:MoaD/ThiS family protein [Chloroflexota bacterium]
MSLDTSSGRTMLTVTLEYYSWLAKELKGAGEQGTSIELHVRSGASVRDLLVQLASESARFVELVYDPAEGRLKEYAALIVNGRTIELAGGLDRQFEHGDGLLLLPGFSGGSTGG